MLSGNQLRSLPLISLVFFLAFGTSAVAAERVGNFTLLDQNGKAHELHYHNNAKAIVLMSYSTQSGDADSLKVLQSLGQKFGSQEVESFLIDGDPQDSRETVRQQTDGLDLPVMMDEGQLITETLDIQKVGETLVIDPSHWELRYRGPVEGAEAILAKMVEGQTMDFVQQPMPADAPALAVASKAEMKQRQNISYRKTIAPLLKEKCADCHRPEGIGPWAMTSHTMIKGFAPMIREVVLTRRMPPWHADPHVNQFKDDISLSLDEKQTLIHWIDAGAPRGEGEDPLTQIGAPESEWILGEPDLVVEMPSFDIPATGVLDYQMFEVPNPYPEDVWVKAAQVIPGDRKVVHHAILMFGEPADPSRPVRPAGEGEGGEGSAVLQEQLMTFVPGNEHYIYPKETGLRLPAGSSFFTQMHYTTSGKATTDKTKIGLWFRDDAPEHVLRHYTVVNLDINIPPGEGEHQEAAYKLFHEDAVIYSLFPHAHYRGRASEFALRYPDGREELVLSLPNYDFNWQRYFRLEEPLQVPAGSKLIHRTTFDNSAQKDSNPDPSKTITWGLQSWDEMLYGGVSYRYKKAHGKSAKPDLLQYRTDLMMGFMDKDMDGELVADEMTGEMAGRLAKMAPWFDANKSGGLSHDELKRMFVTMAEEQRKRQAEQQQTSR